MLFRQKRKSADFLGKNVSAPNERLAQKQTLRGMEKKWKHQDCWNSDLDLGDTRVVCFKTRNRFLVDEEEEYRKGRDDIDLPYTYPRSTGTGRKGYYNQDVKKMYCSSVRHKTWKKWLSSCWIVPFQVRLSDRQLIIASKNPPTTSLTSDQKPTNFFADN